MTRARARATPAYRIDPFDLRLFAAVVEAGSITAGAARAHLSLAAASTRLQNLEHALGAGLLLRSKQGVALTDAGRTLLRHAGRLQRELDTLHAEMAAHAHGVRSTVRVLCNTAAMTEYLPPLLGRFLAAQPHIDVDLRELGSQDVLLALRQDHADIGIVADYVATDGLTTAHFVDDPLVALLPAARGLRAAPPSPLRFEDLLQRPFVGLAGDSGLNGFLQRQALRHGRGLLHRVRVRSVEALVGLVAEGVGVAVVSAAAARRLPHAQVRVEPLAEPWAERRLLLCTLGGEAGLGVGAAKLYRNLLPAADESPR